MKVGTQYVIVKEELAEVDDISEMGPICKPDRDFLEANGYMVASIYNRPLNELELEDHEEFVADKKERVNE
jgi:hypothetical protein